MPCISRCDRVDVASESRSIAINISRVVSFAVAGSGPLPIQCCVYGESFDMEIV